MDRVLSVAALKSTRGGRTQTVDLSAYGADGVVIVKKLTVAGRDRFATTGEKDKDNRLASLAVLLQEGLAEPALSEADARELCECDADMVDALLKAILEFNGMTKEAADDLKRQFPVEPRPEIPVSAGAETAHDR